MAAEDWLPVAAVAEWLKVPADKAGLEGARDAAAEYVEEVRRDLVVDDEFTPPASVVLGAKMLTARLMSRQGSPAGVASFGDFGPAVILRYDSDIERMLGLGRYARPKAR